MPVETFILAVFKIGLATAFGRFIDFMMDKAEKKRLRDWLSELVLKLEYGRWDTLGADEARAALRTWDYVVGSRLLSRRRLFAAIYVMAISTAWASDFGFMFGKALHWLAQDGAIPVAARGYVFQILVVSPLLLTGIVAVSFSLTRLLSTLALRQSGGIGTYLVLLMVNVALFAVWQPLMTMFYAVITSWWVSHGIMTILMIEAGISGWYAILVGSFANWPQSLFRLILPYDYASALLNGVRIAFSLAFVLSFTLRTYVRAPFLRLGYAIVDSDKPVFTLVLGGLTTAVVVSHELMKLVR